MELTGKNYTRNDWRKLLATRRGTVIVAGVCALVAAGILLLAMNSYRHNVDTSGNQETVLVASGLIQKGTLGRRVASEQLFKSDVGRRQAGQHRRDRRHRPAARQGRGRRHLPRSAADGGGLRREGRARVRTGPQPARDDDLARPGARHGRPDPRGRPRRRLRRASTSKHGRRAEPALRLLLANIKVLQAGSGFRRRDRRRAEPEQLVQRRHARRRRHAGRSRSPTPPTTARCGSCCARPMRRRPPRRRRSPRSRCCSVASRSRAGGSK